LLNEALFALLIAKVTPGPRARRRRRRMFARAPIPDRKVGI
jgi:hypothetical protein